MIYAARFAALITSPDKAAFLGAVQAVSLVCIPNPEGRELFCDRFPDILEHTALALGTDGAGLKGISIVPFLADSPTARVKNEFTAKIDRLIAEGRHMIVISPSLTHLSVSAKAICGSPDYLPQITGDMVIDILRFTHSMTEQLSEIFVRRCLPTDADIQKMPQPLLQSAFAEPTTIKVARRIYANNLLSLSTQKMLDLDPLSPLGSIVNADLKSRYLHEITDGFQAKRIIDNWIGFYNSERPHTALDKRTPDTAYFTQAEIRKAA